MEESVPLGPWLLLRLQDSKHVVRYLACFVDSLVFVLARSPLVLGEGELVGGSDEPHEVEEFSREYPFGISSPCSFGLISRISSHPVVFFSHNKPANSAFSTINQRNEQAPCPIQFSAALQHMVLMELFMFILIGIELVPRIHDFVVEIISLVA
jgi:hypothetical protein